MPRGECGSVVEWRALRAVCCVVKKRSLRLLLVVHSRTLNTLARAARDTEATLVAPEFHHKRHCSVTLQGVTPTALKTRQLFICKDDNIAPFSHNFIPFRSLPGGSLQQFTDHVSVRIRQPKISNITANEPTRVALRIGTSASSARAMSIIVLEILNRRVSYLKLRTRALSQASRNVNA